jgi:hypothetical protein
MYVRRFGPPAQLLPMLRPLLRTRPTRSFFVVQTSSKRPRVKAHPLRCPSSRSCSPIRRRRRDRRRRRRRRRPPSCDASKSTKQERSTEQWGEPPLQAHRGTCFARRYLIVLRVGAALRLDGAAADRRPVRESRPRPRMLGLGRYAGVSYVRTKASSSPLKARTAAVAARRRTRRTTVSSLALTVFSTT